MALIDKYTNDEFIDFIKNSFSYRELARKIGYKSYSGDLSQILKNKIFELNLSTNHFERDKTKDITRTFDNIFCSNSTADQKTLRKWYFDGHYTPYSCKICGQLPVWNGKELVLTLDHINGNNHDDRLENLRWVCPNCDRQLDTFGGKNISKKNNKKYCFDCGIEIGKKSTYCKKCSPKHRKNLYEVKLKKSVLYESGITRDRLKDLVRQKSFVDIGKIYDVSNTTIKEWCKKFNLPFRKKEIELYTDNEWENI